MVSLSWTLIFFLYRPQTKLQEGYVFTGVCDSVHRGGACSWGVSGPVGVSAPGGLAGSGPWGRDACSREGQGVAWWRPPRKATAAGGTHPTGMHSCLLFLWLLTLQIRRILTFTLTPLMTLEVSRSIFQPRTGFHGKRMQPK